MELYVIKLLKNNANELDFISRKTLMNLGLLSEVNGRLIILSFDDFLRNLKASAEEKELCHFVLNIISDISEEGFSPLMSMPGSEVIRKPKRLKLLANYVAALCWLYNICEAYFIRKSYMKQTRFVKWVCKKLNIDEFAEAIRRLRWPGNDLVLVKKGLLNEISNYFKPVTKLLNDVDNFRYGEISEVFPLFIWGRGFEHILITTLLKYARNAYLLGYFLPGMRKLAEKLSLIIIVLSLTARFNKISDVVKFVRMQISCIELIDNLPSLPQSDEIWDFLAYAIYCGEIEKILDEISRRNSSINAFFNILNIKASRIRNWWMRKIEGSVYDIVKLLPKLRKGDIRLQHFLLNFYGLIKHGKILVKVEEEKNLLENVLNLEKIFPLKFFIKDLLGFDPKYWRGSKRENILRWGLITLMAKSTEFIQRLTKLVIAYLLAREDFDKSYQYMVDLLFNASRQYLVNDLWDLLIEIAYAESRNRALSRAVALVEFFRVHSPNKICEIIREISNETGISLPALAFSIYLFYLHAKEIVSEFVIMVFKELEDLDNQLIRRLSGSGMRISEIRYGTFTELALITHENLRLENLYSIATILNRLGYRNASKIFNDLATAIRISTRELPRDISELARLFVDISIIVERLKELPARIRELPIVAKIIDELNIKKACVEDVWQDMFLSEYKKMIKEEILQIGDLIPTPEVIEVARKELKPDEILILLVIDGMSYESFAFKMRPLLQKYGFELVKECIGISLIPSITNHSRRAIFLKDIPSEFFKSRKDISEERSIPSERDLLDQVYYGAFLYKHFKYSVSDAITWFLTRFEPRKDQDLIAIVIQSLEKIQHGASEETIARITREFAESIMRLLLVIRDKLRSAGIKPLIVITSDHGLVKGVKDTVELTPEELAMELNLATMPRVEHRFLILETQEDLEEIRSKLRKFIGERGVLVTRANEIGIKRVLLEGREVYGEDIVFVFPKGKWKFSMRRNKKEDRRILHGGLMPQETIIPIAIIRPSS